MVAANLLSKSHRYYYQDIDGKYYQSEKVVSGEGTSIYRYL